MKVACALIIQKQKIMIARRPENKSHPGRWEFPGGKVERGERIEEALIRELHEELGLILKEKSLIHLGQVQVGSIELESFILRHPGPLIPKEHMALTWVRWHSLTTFDLCESDRETIKRYEETIKRGLNFKG